MDVIKTAFVVGFMGGTICFGYKGVDNLQKIGQIQNESAVYAKYLESHKRVQESYTQVQRIILDFDNENINTGTIISELEITLQEYRDLKKQEVQYLESWNTSYENTLIKDNLRGFIGYFLLTSVYGGISLFGILCKNKEKNKNEA